MTRAQKQTRGRAAFQNVSERGSPRAPARARHQSRAAMPPAHGVTLAHSTPHARMPSTLNVRAQARSPAQFYESIDYAHAVNAARRGALGAPTTRTARARASFIKYVITFAIGVSTGIVAWAIEGTTTKVIEMQAALMNAYYAEVPATCAMIFGCTALAFGIAAAYLAIYYAPMSGGGGVTAVMATLNGANIPRLLSTRTLAAKIVGVASGVASSLAIGPEGPMIHIGAALASAWTLVWPKAALCDGEQGRTGAGGSTREGESVGASDSDTVEEVEQEIGARESSEETDEEDVREALTRSRSRRRSRLPRSRLAFIDGAELDALLLDLASQSTQREFISAGAAAGLAAAFGAPIGGVLFSFEEASTFWSHRTMWRCLMCAATASFVLALLDLRGNPGMVFITGDELRPTTPRDYFHQLPFFVLVAAISGLSGAAFNKIQQMTARIRPLATNKAARLFECALVVIATVAMRFLASKYFGRCFIPPDSWIKDGFGVRFGCDEGEINDIATVFFVAPGRSIGWMFGMAEHVWGENYGFEPRGLAIAAACYLIMMAMAFGIAVPGGLFMPSLLLGACSGGCAGLVLKSALPDAWDIQPGLYALIGATAALGGVFRSSVSLVVIMVEGTNGQSFVFVIIVAVVVSNAVGNWLAHGIYHAELQRSKTVAYLPREPSSKLAGKTAGDIMAMPVAFLPKFAPVDVVRALLEHTPHNGFPVVDERGKLVGLILRSQLEVLLRDPHQGAPGADVLTQSRLDLDMRTAHMSPDSHPATPGVPRGILDDSVDAIEVERLMRANSTPSARPGTPAWRDAEIMIDIETYMNAAPLAVHLDFPAPRAHDVFLALALRHLVVVDGEYAVVGVITRKDLIAC